jgi:PKD repeat protein
MLYADFTTTMIRLLGWYVLLLCTVSLPSQLMAQCVGNCTALVYEGFGYPANTPLLGQVGGSGWASGWEVQNGNVAVPGYAMLPNSLTTGTLRTTQQQLSGGSQFVQMGRAFNTATNGPLSAFRTSGGSIGQPGTVLWMSVVLQKNQTNDDRVSVGLHNGNTTWNDDQNQPRLAVGYFGAASNSGSVRYWGLRLGTSVTNTSVPLSTTAPALLVLRLSFGATQTNVDLWVNPTPLGSGIAPTPTLSTTYAVPFSFKSLAGYLGNGAGQGRLDEIRFSDTYRCVVPDTNVPENQQPIAQFTASSTTGNVPVSISFNASASTDPDGSIVRYDWLFADGGRATGPVVSYTFAHPGIQTAVLTVTDNCSLVSSQTVTLTLREADGSLPCYSSPRLDRLATCNRTDGQLSVSGGSSSTLTNAQSQTVAGMSGTFGSLPPGAYTLVVAGAGGCRDQFTLHVPVDSATCPGWLPRPYAMQIGMGLEGLTDWEQARPFRDFFKTTRRFQTYNATGNSPWDTELAGYVPRDTAGYPLQVPYTVTTATGSPHNGLAQRIRTVVSTEGHMPPGQYVLLHDGLGTFAFSGDVRRVAGQPTTPGRILLEVTGLGNCWIDLLTSTLGNHVRNCRLVRLADEADFVGTLPPANPFYSVFLERTCHWNVLRFMDWQRTNNSDLVHWADRAQPNAYSQTLGGGVAYEYIIRLANILQKDVWVNVPHQATDDYIRQMARLFRDGLNPSLNVFLEYSNEVWNWQFEQAAWVDQNGPAFLPYPRKYALRARHVFRIWHDEWGAARSRVKRVAGTQSVNNWLGQHILGQLNGEFDYFSPTWYFNYKDSPTAYAQLEALGATATPQQVLAAARAGFLHFWPNVRQNYRDAWLYGKEIAHYEGGQHMTSNPTIEPFQTANYAAQIAPGMGTLYREVLDSLAKWRTHTATAFVLTSRRESQYGSWGHIEFIEQDTLLLPAPKYQALLRYVGPAQVSYCNPNRIISRQSGDWWRPESWHWWRAPRATDEVEIRAGHTIQLPLATPWLRLRLWGRLRIGG